MPGNSFKDRELAKRARALSIKGPHKKTLEWNEFGSLMVGKLMEDYLEAIEKKPLDERIQLLKDLLNYFKPKLSSQEIKAEIDNITPKIRTVYDDLQQQPIIPESEPEQG